MGIKSVWGYRLTLLVLSFAVIFFALLPFGLDRGRTPGPDLLICLVSAWVLRRR